MKRTGSKVNSKAGDDCPFCSYAAGRFGRELIVYEDDKILVIPSLHQKSGNRGHCLVVTREHVPNLYDLPGGDAAPLLAAASAAATA